MIAAYRLDNMAEKTQRRDKPFYGRVIESRRAFLGNKSAMNVENETKGVIYQKLLYRIEGGDKDPLTLDLTQFSALLKALEWTPEEFARETELALPEALRPVAEATVREVPSRVRVVPTYHLVVPRQGEGTAMRGEDEYIPLEKDLPGDFTLYIVEGEDLKPVSYVVRRQRSAAVGDTVVCDLDGFGVSVALLTAIEGDMFALTDIRGRGHLVRNPRIRGVAIKKLEDLPNGVN